MKFRVLPSPPPPSICLALIAGLSMAAPLQAEVWKMAECPIPTIWAAKVNPAAPWPEYPRPQFVRDKWTNLNGL